MRKANTYRPTSAGRRHQTARNFRELSGNEPPKALLAGARKRTGGRNNLGRITTWQRSGGHKRQLRLVDFKRLKDGIPAVVASVDYDPNRSARLALLHYADGAKAYILAPVGLLVGATVTSGKGSDIRPGNCLELADIPLGTQVHNIELKPGKGGQMVRSAGGSAQLMAKDGDYAQVKLPSGEQRKVLMRCRATIGQVGNVDHENVSLGKAGRKRWLGRRSHVRGTAMNPVDHPHGGGEGRSKGGNHPVTPWGVPTKGYKTRRNKLTTKFIVQSRKRS